MTLATTTSADGLIVNKCAHCATYCVIALDDLHPVLAAGKRPQILCHHCQKLFAPGPDMNVPDEELSPPADSAPAVKHDDSQRLRRITPRINPARPHRKISRRHHLHAAKHSIFS